ncbi:putative Conserved membrane protein [Sorangium cellulosum So ce56]|uniref:Conserved membrane protein n=1 Tax=Sorangium cellulosum (strain So ce56) TaxID=448385 RepID=A9FVN6_SORC5|nr:EamA family transporter [Sorangium cellulosum]CAN92295.1 putative Conserved membrane protein [Sorangium cellulosum So ce56]
MAQGYLFLIIALVFNATANILMKLASRRVPSMEGLSLVEKALALVTNYHLVLGLVLFASNILFYVLALKRINLSIAYPIMSSGGFLLISVFSVYFLHETLTGLQIGGIVLIAAGIALLAYNIA